MERSKQCAGTAARSSRSVMDGGAEGITTPLHAARRAAAAAATAADSGAAEDRDAAAGAAALAGGAAAATEEKDADALRRR
jgi:hypothetical protein